MTILYDLGGMMGGGGGGGGGGGSSTPILGDLAKLYGDYEKRDAADDMLDTQKRALQLQRIILAKELDPNRLDQIAVEYDTRQLERRQEFLQKYEPELYQLREASKQQLLAQATRTKGQDPSHILAGKLFNEVREEDPRLRAMKESLIDRAQEDINAGAKLSPEFQAELVRAGLDAGSQAGIGFSKGAIGGGVARVLGLAGEQLKQQRNAEAVNLTNAAQNLATARTNILASVFPKLRDLETADRNESVQNFLLTERNTPNVGLSGADAVNAHLTKTNARIGGIQQYSNIAQQRKMAHSQERISIANDTANLIGDIASVYGGGMGGMMGGMGGAAGAMTAPSGGSGLQQRGGAGVTPANYNTSYIGSSPILNYLNSYGQGV